MRKTKEGNPTGRFVTPRSPLFILLHPDCIRVTRKLGRDQSSSWRKSTSSQLHVWLLYNVQYQRAKGGKSTSLELIIPGFNDRLGYFFFYFFCLLPFHDDNSELHRKMEEKPFLMECMSSISAFLFSLVLFLFFFKLLHTNADLLFLLALLYTSFLFFFSIPNLVDYSTWTISASIREKKI